ncbi:MAG TPA: UPF0158 family protein, partial [Gammaproteobacteria bacterium]|nr:UPF0158 family protein [Gammaproteobacteria bacterium]
MKIKLNDLLEALEFQSDEHHFFIHLKTGEVVLLSDEAMQLAEDGNDDFLDWQEEDVAVAKDYLENEDDYLAVPSKQEVNEYQMMEAFALNIGDEKTRDQLLSCLRGKGAFRR